MPRRPDPHGHDAESSSADSVSPADFGLACSLLERGQGREALALARRLVSHDPSPQNLHLLCQATLLRSREMVERGMLLEARALLQRLRSEHPDLGGTDVDIRVAALDMRLGQVDPLLERLQEPACPPTERNAIESAFRRELTDLSLLGESRVLASDHPLRVAALALQRAFRAVTSGPVTEEDIELAEVSRRSPLAPWKSLVQALAAFHRGDAAACERRLSGIDPSSAPARLAPVLRDLLTGRTPPQATHPAAVALKTAVEASARSLRQVLAGLDETLSPHRRPRKPEAGIHDATQACARLAPGLLTVLRQRISLRAFALALNATHVRKALGGPALKNAVFWRQMARMLGQTGEPRQLMQTCCAWEEFRKHAIHEHWFAQGSVEEAAVRLRMADTLAPLAPRMLSDLREHPAGLVDYSSWYGDQPEGIRAAVATTGGPRGGPLSQSDFLRPEWLYREACQADPHAESFERWAAWASRQAAELTQALEAWRAAIPEDVRPLLRLSEAAEKRGALKKAAGLLDEAELLDPLHPAVRRGRVRLLVATALRHIGQNKPHLVAQDATRARNLAAGTEEFAALAAALTWTSQAMVGYKDGAFEALDEGAAALGSEAAALVLFSSLNRASGLGGRAVSECFPNRTSFPPDQTLATVMARAWSVCDTLGLPCYIPDPWLPPLLESISTTGGSLDALRLHTLADMALRGEHHEITWVATNAGLAKGGPTTARFLLLRARSMPFWLTERRQDCATAAIVLARRNHDTDLIPEAVEFRREMGSPFRLFEPETREDFEMPPEQVERVLAAERESTEWPGDRAPQPSRRRRGGFDSFHDIDASEFLDSLPESLLDIFLRMGGPQTRRRRR